MIFVDASQLARFLRAHKPVTGIQRLTLNSLMGLHALLGADVAALVFDDSLGAFRQLPVEGLFAGETGVPARFAAGDRLLFMEWYWSQRVFEAGLAAGKAEGGRHYRFLHDVIPVARPEFVRPENTRRFRANTALAIAAADVVLTNSEFSRQDILKHFPESAAKPLIALPLPHEFTVIEAGGTIVRVGADTSVPAEKLRPAIKALAGRDFALMVGTLEERKNSLAAVKAWGRVARRLGPAMPKLVMVGFYSAHSLPYTIELVARMTLSRHIIHLSDCSDWELCWLYQHCRFTLYISQYEGWGLPVGESLWFGKPVLTQRVSSLGEAGGAAASYVDVNRPGALDSAIEGLVRAWPQEAGLAATQATPLRSNQAFAAALLHHLQG